MILFWGKPVGAKRQTPFKWSYKQWYRSFYRLTQSKPDDAVPRAHFARNGLRSALTSFPRSRLAYEFVEIFIFIYFHWKFGKHFLRCIERWWPATAVHPTGAICTFTNYSVMEDVLLATAFNWDICAETKQLQQQAIVTVMAHWAQLSPTEPCFCIYYLCINTITTTKPFLTKKTTRLTH